jgi:hypothetical protein
VPYNYTTYTTELANLSAYSLTDPSFVTNLPSAIDYSEQRIYRELDLLATNVSDYSTTLTANSRNVSIPETFVVTDTINVLTPTGSGNTDGTRNPLARVSKEVVNALWPSNTAPATPSIPTMFAMIDQWNLIVAPAPDAGYSLEVIGTTRPAPLSSTNPNTFLTDHLPDLFMAASMIFMSGFMRNFSASGNDPGMSVNWESQYEKLLASALSEEARKYGWGASWTTYPASAAAQPQRG